MDLGIRLGKYVVGVSLLPVEFLLGISFGAFDMEDGPCHELAVGAVFVWLFFREYEEPRQSLS
jgi:hypothetical protein